MSQGVLDQGLIELTRKWVTNLNPLAKQFNPWGAHGRWVLYNALAKAGFEAIGQRWGDVYMRRGDTIISVFIGSPSLFGMDEGWLGQLGVLGTKEPTGLVLTIEVWLGNHVCITYHGRERVSLGTVGEYNTHLHNLVLWAGGEDGYLQLGADVKRRGVVQKFYVLYTLEDNGTIDRDFLETIGNPQHLPHQVWEAVLKNASGKSTVLDGLLDRVYQLITKALG
jgi:hypothetical protein